MSTVHKNFTGVLLAAGKGTRLGAVTENNPKALVTLGGHALIEYGLDFLRGIGASEIIVVTGFHGDEVAELVRKVQPDAKLARNEEFNKSGNLPGLLAAMGVSDKDFLVMNTDHLYRVSMRAKVPESLGDTITVFCDFKEKLDPDERGILLGEDGFIKKIDKHLDRWDCGCVGLTYIPASRRETYMRAVPATLEKLGDAAGYENVLQTLADMGEKIAVADVSGICPIEIDYPEELARAEEAVVREPGAFGLARI